MSASTVGLAAGGPGAEGVFGDAGRRADERGGAGFGTGGGLAGLGGATVVVEPEQCL